MFYIQFFVDKIKKAKKTIKNLTLPHWDLNPGFLNKTFLPKIWIWGFEIISIELTARFLKNLNFDRRPFEGEGFSTIAIKSSGLAGLTYGGAQELPAFWEQSQTS